jgi:hypothetical protein
LAGPATPGGPLQFSLDYFRDRDGDGVFDEVDDCPTIRATTSDGCPPLLKLESARLRVAAALRDFYPSSFRSHKRLRRSCYRITRNKVACNVRWDKGAFRYTGTVWFRNDLDDPPVVVWTDARVHRKRIHPKPAPPSRSCDPNYGGCLDPNASDYDCIGGGGNGPRYTGPVRVLGDDHFDLDRNGDGIGCNDS